MTNTTLQQRAAQLRDQGRRTAYAIDYATVSDPAKATHLHICLGEQWSGKRLYMVDLDSHTEGQNADAAKAAFEAERPELAARLDWHRSKSNTGWHAYFESSVQIPTGKLHDAANNHIGDLLGADSDRTLDPGDVRIPVLHAGEIERLTAVWHVKGSDPKGEQWKDRAKQGLRWVYGYNRIHVTKIELRAHLKRNCGPNGTTADLLFDQKEPFNRSAAFSRLIQTLMLHAHKLPGQQNTGFVERCTAVMAYAMASAAYGKAGDKGYTVEKDAASLIAQIVNGDPYGDGQRRTIPFWAKSHATAAPAPQPAPEAPRPAHRPAGDRAKHLMTFRRILEAIEPDDFGRRTYTLEQLADKMKIARCAVAPRTIQNYLHDLREDGEIVTAQIGGNGIPYTVLKPCFGGADNYQKRVETDAKPDNFGGANEIAEQGILTPQSAETTPQCKEDHQDTCAPTAEPGGAAYVPGADWTAGGRLDLSGWRDPSEIRIPSDWIDRTPPPRHFRRRQPRQKGQRTIEAEIREPMAERQARDLDARIERLAANVAHAEAAGQLPAKRAERLAELRALRDKGYPSAPLIPTPYQSRAALPLETLPEPPAAAAPAGAQSAGAPLPGPQAGAPAGASPAQLIAERRRRQEAQRQQVGI